MNNPAISIIVPIYKAEETLLRCLDSLKAQTFTDFEVLMVDDGSLDRCGEMIDAYAQKDSRFKAYHKENGGVSSARQYGIDHAQGEFTIHADPDDWVEPTMLEELYGKAKEEDADMVICDFFENTYKGQKYVNKLIRRVCYSMFDIHFPSEINFCEDKYVIATILKNDIKVTYLPCAYYHYVRNEADSLSMRYSVKTYDENIRLRELFDSLLGDTPFREEVYNQQSYMILSKAFYAGKSYYSSSKFQKVFRSYKPFIEQNDSIGFFEKTLLRFSVVGFYQSTIRLFTLIMKLKHHIYNFIK